MIKLSDIYQVYKRVALMIKETIDIVEIEDSYDLAMFREILNKEVVKENRRLEAELVKDSVE
jgi:hypothetical protein